VGDQFVQVALFLGDFSCRFKLRLSFDERLPSTVSHKKNTRDQSPLSLLRLLLLTPTALKTQTYNKNTSSIYSPPQQQEI
jgi:hypothetical protein